MNARWDADASAWIRSTLPKAAMGPYAYRMFSISVIVLPPDEDGGIEISV